MANSGSSGYFWCHSCQLTVEPVTDEVICPNCQSGFVEEMEGVRDSSRMPLPGNMEENHETAEATVEDSPSYTNFPIGLGFVYPGNGPPQLTNVFRWDVSNSRSGPSTSRSDSVAISRTPYNLRQRPSRSGSVNHETTQRTTGYRENDLIEDVIRRVFGGVEPPFLEFSLGGGGNFPAFNFMELHANTGDYAWGPNGLDNIISQLLGQLENAGPPPATEEAIKNLPIITISEKDIEAGRDCSVCMDAFKLKENAKKLPCNHFFHIPCIDPWLELHNTCPICRKVVEGASCEAPESPENPGANNIGANNSNPASSSSQNPQDGSSSLFSLFSSFAPRHNRRQDHS